MSGWGGGCSAVGANWSLVIFGSVFVFIVVPVSKRCSACVACSSGWGICFWRLFCSIGERHGGGTSFRCLLGKKHLKKVCIGSEPLDQPVPYAEITPFSRFVCCFESEKLPVSIVGVSPSLLRIVRDSRVDRKRFLVCQ